MRGAIRDTWELGFLWEFNPLFIVLLCLCKVGVLTANITEPIHRQTDRTIVLGWKPSSMLSPFQSYIFNFNPIVFSGILGSMWFLSHSGHFIQSSTSYRELVSRMCSIPHPRRLLRFFNWLMKSVTLWVTREADVTWWTQLAVCPMESVFVVCCMKEYLGQNSRSMMDGPRWWFMMIHFL